MVVSCLALRSVLCAVAAILGHLVVFLCPCGCGCALVAFLSGLW